MERLDALVAGIGVLVVATALAGVLAAGPPEGPQTFRIVFAEQRTALPAQQGAFTGDGATDVAVRVTQLNLTSLAFTVRVSGAGPRTAADAVDVTLQGPDGRRESRQASLAGPGTAGEATATFERALGAAPEPQASRGRDAASAIAALPPRFTTNNGTGTWTVTVTARTAGLPALHTEGHTVVVEATAASYEAVVQPDVANPR